MSSPISQETLQEIRERAEDVAKQFGISYSLNAAWTLYERAREAAEVKKPETLKLTYREFDSVDRTDLLAGYIDVKKGEGPGVMGSWKRVYCVERSDYGIEFYSSKEAFENKEKPTKQKKQKKPEKPKKPTKPKTAIQPAGYKVLTQNIAKPFRDLIKPIAKGLDVDPSTLEGMVNFPHDSWALFHPQRTKYVFRESKNNVPDEKQIDRKEWIYFFKTCVRRSKPRNTDTVMGMAFERTCDKISEKVDSLKDWTDDGREDEMLLEMAMTSCLPPVQDSILDQINSRMSIPIPLFRSFAAIIASRVLIPIWYKVVGFIKTQLQKLLKVTWAKIQQGVQLLLDKIEPVLAKGLTPITKVHNKILDGIKTATNKTLGRLLSKHATPLIEPLITAYAKPLTEGISYVRETYWAAVDYEEYPFPVHKRMDYLDGIPRRRDTMKAIYLFSLRMSRGLRPVKRLIDGTVKMTKGGSYDAMEGKDDVDEGEEDEEEDEDAKDVCAEVERGLLKGLDAAVYTLYLRLEGVEDQSNDIHEKILTQDFDHDAVQLKRDVVKNGIRQFVLKYLKMAIHSNGELSQAISSVDACIPSEMQDFLSVQGIFDTFIDITVGEPIDRMVEASNALKLNGAEQK